MEVSTWLLFFVIVYKRHFVYDCVVPPFGAHRALASYIVTTKTTNTQTNKNAWRNKRVGG